MAAELIFVNTTGSSNINSLESSIDANAHCESASVACNIAKSLSELRTRRRPPEQSHVAVIVNKLNIHTIFLEPSAQLVNGLERGIYEV